MTIIYTNCNARLVDGNQLKWKVQYDIIYNNIYTEIVIAMLMFNMPCCYNLSVALNNSGIGGYLGDAFLNNLCYADDMSY